MRKRPSQEDAGSLDSLLDTMTNVVGILIIVLVMTQLNISQTMEKIRERQKERNISEADVAAMQADLDAARQSLSSAVDPAARKLELTQQVATLEQQNRDLTKEQAPVDPGARQRQLDLQDQRQDEITRQLTRLEKEIRQIRLDIDKAEKTETPEPFRVRMPNPRPPPEGARQVIILCAYNQVYTLDLDRYHNAVGSVIFQARRELALPNQKAEKATDIVYDPNKVAEYFAGKPRFLDQFQIGVAVQPTRKNMNLTLLPVKGKGESIQDIREKSSRYLSLLAKVYKDKNYIRFRVRSDSFEAYQMARRACDFYNIPTGWDILGDSPVHQYLPKIKVKQLKEPPPPKPTDPNKPKPPNNLLD